MGDPFARFDKKKIGFGKFFRSGKGYEKRVGLEGAFRELKDPSHGLEAANLSQAEVSKFRNLLEEKLRHKADYTKGLNWQDRRDMLHQLEQLRLSGQISLEDEKDFQKIIDKLSDK